MNSNACIVTLNKSLGAETISALNLLNEKTSEKFNVTTKAYSSIKPLLSQLSERLQENALVIIASEPALFYSAKEVFCQALSLNCTACEDVIAALPTSYFPKTEREYKAVTTFPTGADVISTANGLFSGFCVSAGTQRIVFVPLDEKILGTMFGGALADIFDKIADENNIVVSDISIDDEEEPITVDDSGNAQEDKAEDSGSKPEADIPVSTVDAPVSAEIPAVSVSEPKTINADAVASSAAPKSESARLLEAAEQMINTLKESGFTIAFAQSGPFKSLKGLINAIPDAGETAVFDNEIPEKWTSGQFNPYFASLAKKTFENCGTDFAGALSTLYTDAGGKFMFYVVADSTGAKITKVNGDEANAIVYKCVTGLINAITKRAESKAELMPGVKKSNGNKIVKSSAPLVIASVMLVLAIIASAAVAFFMKGKSEENAIPSTTVLETLVDESVTEEVPEEITEETSEEKADDEQESESTAEKDAEGTEEETEKAAE